MFIFGHVPLVASEFALRAEQIRSRRIDIDEAETERSRPSPERQFLVTASKRR